MTKHLPIVIIMAVATAIHVVQLGDVRWGVHPDETMYGYEGMSIAATGTDHRQTGRPPLYLRGQSSHWDNRTSILYPYLLAGLFQVVPPSMAAERSPAAVASIAIVVLVYLVVRELFPKRRSTAAVAAALTTLSPLGFIWGRIGHDLIFLPFFTLILIWSVLRSRRQPGWWFLATTAAALALYAYQPGKLVIPLLALLLAWYVRPTLVTQWRTVWVAVVVGLVVATPMVVTQLTHWREVQGEFGNISLFSRPGEWWRIPGEFGRFLTGTYALSYRVVLPFLLPFSLVTIWLLRRQRRTVFLFIGWFVIALIPAMFTRLHVEGIDMQWRSIAVYGLFEVLAAVTIVELYDHLRQTRIFRVLHHSFAAGMTAICLMPMVAATWLMVGGGEHFCCQNYGRLEQIIAFIQQPAWRERPVVFQLTSYTLPDYVLWMTKYPPRDFIRGPVRWSTFTYPELGEGEHPTQFGRYTLCDLGSCDVPSDALVVVPKTVPVPGKTLMTVSVFAPQWAWDYPWEWKVVDRRGV